MQTILLVEDDFMQAEGLMERIKDQLGVESDLISTELGFQTRFEEIAQDPPVLIIMDVMLRWADPQPVIQRPPDGYDGFHRAGIRCLKMLRSDPRTKELPVILHSVLEESDVLPDMKCCGATAVQVLKSIHAEAILSKIKSLLPPAAHSIR